MNELLNYLSEDQKNDLYVTLEDFKDRNMLHPDADDILVKMLKQIEKS